MDQWRSFNTRGNDIELKEVRAPDTTFEQDYVLPFSIPKIILLGGFLISLAFYYTYPVEKIFHHFLSMGLKANPQCQIGFKDYKFGLFLPNLQFSEVAIPNRCITPKQKMLVADKVIVSFGGLNFSPLGAVINTELGIGKNVINLKASSDGTDHVVKLDGQKIYLEPFAELINDKIDALIPSLKGTAIVDLHLKSKAQRLEIFDLKIQSKDFEFPSQSLMGFAIPLLNLKTLNISAKGKGKQILVEKMTLGTNDSPIYVEVSGSIGLDERVINNSNIDLRIDLRFSDQIFEQYSIFKMVLAQFDKGDNNYSMKLTGTLSKPRPSPVK